METFLSQWIYSDAVKEFLEEDDLKQMAIDLEQIIVLAQDLIRLRDIQSSHIKDLLKFYTTENMILRQEIAHLRLRLQAKGKKATTKKKNKKKAKKN